MAALANIITQIVNRETKKIPESALHICKVYKATSGARVAINSVEHIMTAWKTMEINHRWTFWYKRDFLSCNCNLLSIFQRMILRTLIL